MLNLTRTAMKESAATMVILSPTLWILRIHWGGKSLICPNTRCPGCAVDRGKLKGYAIAHRPDRPESTAGLIEVGPDTLRQLTDRNLQPEAARGFAWRMERRTGTNGWKVIATTHMEPSLPEPAEHELPDAIETLFALPFRIGTDGELVKPKDPRPWLEAHRRILTTRISLNLKELAK